MQTITPQAAITFSLGVLLGIVLYLLVKNVFAFFAIIVCIGFLDQYFKKKKKSDEERL